MLNQKSQVFRKKILFIFSIFCLVAICLLIVKYTSTLTVQADTGPAPCSTPNTDLGYCSSGNSTYYCGVKFNQSSSVTFKFNGTGIKVQVDDSGNALLNYNSNYIVSNCIFTGGSAVVIQRGTNCLIAKSDSLALYNGISDIIENPGSFPAATSQDTIIYNNIGVAKAMYDASAGKLYIKGIRVNHGFPYGYSDAIPATANFTPKAFASGYFPAYDASQGSVPHYCKYIAIGNTSKLILQYGCYISVTDYAALATFTDNSCKQCNPNIALDGWTNLNSGSCLLSDGTHMGTCAAGNCQCTGPQCDNGFFCDGAEVCSSNVCSTPGNPCMSQHKNCNEGTDTCEGCMDDFACSNPTPGCGADSQCHQCTNTRTGYCSVLYPNSCQIVKCSSYTCDYDIQANTCFIGGVCYANGTQNPSNQCQVCNSATPTVWSAKGNGTSCTLTNSTATCSSGTCTISSCNSGYGNCDSDNSNGCELHFSSCSSPANSCGQTTSGTVINCSGTCSASTAPGYTSPHNLYSQACTSPANSCGQTTAGTYGCNNTCSVTTAPGYTSPHNLYGQACNSSYNACGQRNSGAYGCNNVCSASTPANPSCYNTSCGSGACAGTYNCSCACIGPSNNYCGDSSYDCTAYLNITFGDASCSHNGGSSGSTYTCTRLGCNGAGSCTVPLNN